MSFFARLFGATPALEPYGYMLRALIGYLALLVMVRLAGHREIKKLSAVDFVIAVATGTMVASPVVDSRVPMWTALVGLAVFTSVDILSAVLAVHSTRFASIVEGRPKVLIESGKVNEAAMASSRLTLEDLMEELRGKGAFSIADVELAVLEPAGAITVEKKPSQQPATRGDLGLLSYHRFPAFLVREGRILHENLEEAGLTEKWLTDQLDQLGVESLSDVFVAQVSSDGTLYVDTFGDEAAVRGDVSRQITMARIRKLEEQLDSYATEAGRQEEHELFHELAQRLRQVNGRLEYAWDEHVNGHNV